MLTNTTNVDRYLINGTPLSTYAIHFPYWDKEEINVYLTNSDGSLSTLTEGTNYTLSTPNGTNGTLTRVGDWTAGATNLTIIREMSLTQEVDLRNGDKIDAETLETALDNLTAQVQQLAETQSRAVVSSVDEAGSNLAIPNKASRIGSGSGTMMGFGSDGESIVLRDLAQFDADVASAASDASSASASAGTATTQALKSEGYAVGEQNGSPVTSGSPYYENNSKHYAQVAKAGADVITDNLSAITNLDTNMTDINAVADDISNVVAVAGNLTKVDAVADDLTNIDAVNANKTNIDTVAGIASDVTNVAGVASDIPTVAGVSTDISTVATDISDVSAVAGDLVKVKAVADDLTNIDAVNANKTNIDTVAGKASEITTVAGIASNVTTVAGIASNVTTVAGKATEVTTVAGIASDVSAVAQVASDVASVADELTDIGTVASNISDVAAVGADIAKVSAVADDLTSIDAVYADLANIDAADDHALEAEGWAAGTQNGVPVTSGSPYYENNAKYYGQEIPNLKSALLQYINEDLSLLLASATERTGYLSINGSYSSDSSLHCKSTDKFPCIEGMVFKYKGLGEYSTTSVLFYQDDTLIGYGQSGSKSKYVDFTVPHNANYVVFSSYDGINNTIVLEVEFVSLNDKIMAQTNALIEDFSDKIVSFSSNLTDPSKRTVGYLNVGNGNIVVDNGFSTSDYIPVEVGETYVKKINTANMGGSATKIVTYNQNKGYIDAIDGTSLGSGWYSYTIPSNVEFIRYSTAGITLSAPTCYFGKGSTALDPVPKYGFEINQYGKIDYSQIGNTPDVDTLEDKIDRIVTISPNLVDPSEKAVGYLNYGDGNVIVDSGYATTGFIPITTGKYVKKILASGMGSAATMLCLYRADKSFYDAIDGTLLETNWYKYNITNSNVAYARFSTSLTSISAPTCYFGKGEVAVSPVPSYGFVINSDGTIDYSQITNAPQPLAYDYKCSLTGKKWYALGDSATHGDGATTLTEGMYAGQLAVYPFYIGNRTGADVHNLAVNGGVIATITDQPSRYQLSKDGNYDAVPSDADIITIWLGANDMWQNVPIGTIDSNDPTTFYGAWNKVLSYYVNNYPNTKLGIVASFWCTQAYAEAVIAIGAKYGVPVLNLYNDPKVPVTVGSQRPDVNSTVKSTRNTQWIVGNGNSHPSSAYHKIESYFIEEWLKTL